MSDKTIRNEYNLPPSEISKRVKGIIEMQNSKTDPNGSYTGVPEDPYEKPIQDVDDL